LSLSLSFSSYLLCEVRGLPLSAHSKPIFYSVKRISHTRTVALGLPEVLGEGVSYTHTHTHTHTPTHTHTHTLSLSLFSLFIFFFPSLSLSLSLSVFFLMQWAC